MRNNHLQQLPSSLGLLKSLEVLDIALNFMVEVPDIIWEMSSLCHLYMSDIICQKPLKIDALKNLETLTYISVDNWTYEMSGLEMNMTSLYTLGIEEVDENSNVSKLFASLDMLYNLGRLILRGFRFRRMPSLDELSILHYLKELKLDGLITCLPKFPPNILNLSLVNTCLDEDPMPVLEKLENLRYLKLQNAYNGRIMVVSQDGFPKLIRLVMAELWHLRNVRVGEGGMPEIRRLEINNCPYLETFPENFGSIKFLQIVKIRTTKNVAKKIREAGIFLKVKNVDIQPQV